MTEGGPLQPVGNKWIKVINVREGQREALASLESLKSISLP